jgi:UDP-N-acetylmuramoyl-tripeptide--D-alanyl-D-alanine ligase
MIQGILSRYRPRYIRSLVYMLQASEYGIAEYIAWYRRTWDFTRVERRKHLVMTDKAKLLLLALWAMAGLMLLVLALAFTLLSLVEWLALVAVTILVMPHVLGYGIVLPLWVGQVTVQRPRERVLIAETQQLLASSQAFHIAVAGSFGKTSFKEILRWLLTEGKIVAATPGNLNTPLGIVRFVERLEGNEEVLVFEMGEYYPGDVAKLCRIVQPDLGVITGINEAHLSKFKNLTATSATVFELADYLDATRPGLKSSDDQQPARPGLVYVNGENRLAKQYARQGHLLFSREGVAGWKITSPQTGIDGTSFKMIKDGLELSIKSRLLGLHQVAPLAAAAEIAHELGLSKEQIEAGAAKIKPLAHRLAPRQVEGDVLIIDDTYNGNPDGVRVALDFISKLERPRKIYATPGLVEIGPKSREIHNDIGYELARVFDVVMLVRNSVTPWIVEGLREADFTGEVYMYETAEDCFNAIAGITKAGDVVLMQNDWPDNYA